MCASPAVCLSCCLPLLLSASPVTCPSCCLPLLLLVPPVASLSCCLPHPDRAESLRPQRFRRPDRLLRAADASLGVDELVELVKTLNADESVDGLLVQLPLPVGVDEKAVLGAVTPEKDVDGFHAVNAGNLLLGNPCLAACTPSGIMELIKSTGTTISGKHAVVVGRSNIVGKPIALMLLGENATVTICHSRTQNLASYTREADILVVAIGKKEFITGDMIKQGSIVIDVGMNREDGKLYGDVEYASASEKAAYITPVPGGVGPMTITMLLKNTVKAAYFGKKQ